MKFIVWKIQISGPNTNTNWALLTSLANEKKSLGSLLFFGKIQIYLNTIFKTNTNKNIFLAYIGQYEYKFDNLDWFLKIQTHIWINSTRNKLFACKYNCHKSTQIIIHMCHGILFLLLNFLCIQLNFQNLPTSMRTDVAPDAKLVSHLVKFSKRGVIYLRSKTHSRY